MDREHNSNRAQPAHPHARARYLAESIRLEEVDVAWSLKGTVYLGLLFTVGAIVWAALTQITEIAIAPGEVVPAGLNHKVQHLEGGIVEEIAVRNGDEVEPGQLLVRIASASPGSELEQAEVRRAALALNAERIAALLEGRDADFSPFESDYPGLTAGQRKALAAQRESFDEQRRAARAQIDQRRDEMNQLANERRARAAEVDVLREQLAMREAVASNGQLARDEVLTLRASLLERETKLSTARDGISVAAAAIKEAQIRVKEIESRFRETLQLEASETAAQLTEIEATLARLSDRVARTDVVAPVRGIVNNLVVNARYSVIEPAATIMEIVPTDDKVMVESRVSPHDIGHLETGLPVEVEISTYDTTRYGTASGTLRHLSASTYLDENREPYYRAEIELVEAHLEWDGRMHRIIPGMRVEADIITGRKSVLDYLLKPVYRGFQSAFHER